uniref:metallophosphoesterase n=1 Tax=uncultured Draconibacterium sp. TaxID=1573823 RepID=UPI003216713B
MRNTKFLSEPGNHTSGWLNWYKIIQCCVLLFFAVEIVGAQTTSKNDSCFFIQLSDPQFGMFKQNANFEKETALYKKAIDGINELKPDFVVITGDFVHNQNSEEQINEFIRLTAAVNPSIPVYYSPGNHDIGVTPDKESLKKYRKNYGKDRFVFSHKGSLFIGFNTSLIKGKLEKEEKEQYKWLEKQLRKSDKFNKTVLFCHYPFFIKNVDEPTAYTNIDIEVRKKYLDLFAANGVDAVFTGHHHDNILNVYGDIELITTSAAGMPLGNAPSGMRIIKIFNDKIEHEYFGFDEIPVSVEF